MPVTEKEDKKSRQRTAAEKMTDAQRVQQRIASGAFKSELRTATEAIWMAKALDQQLRDAMKLAKLEPDEDCIVHIAYMTPDLSTLSTVRFTEGKEREIHAELTGPGKCSIMAGLIFGVRERDAKKLEAFKQKPANSSVWLLSSKPFLSTDLVHAALKQRIEEESFTFPL